MELTRWNPRCSIPGTRSELTTIFDDFFAPFSVKTNNTTHNNMTPAVDIYEQENKVVINAELPGFKKEDINIDFKGKTITFSGERTEDENLKSDNTYRKERLYGKFQRSFNLGFELTAEAINAKYEQGILVVEIAKPQEQEIKQIQIQ